MKLYEKNAPSCECEEIHGDIIEKRRAEMPDGNNRVSILFAIDGEPMCVCDIANLLGMTKSAVSHQLKILRQSDLVTYRKSGKNVFYSLADDHVRDIIEKALEHIKE